MHQEKRALLWFFGLERSIEYSSAAKTSSGMCLASWGPLSSAPLTLLQAGLESVYHRIVNIRLRRPTHVVEDLVMFSVVKPQFG